MNVFCILNNQLLNLQVIEYNDTIKPIITGAKIDLNDNAKLLEDARKIKLVFR